MKGNQFAGVCGNTSPMASQLQMLTRTRYISHTGRTHGSLLKINSAERVIPTTGLTFGFWEEQHDGVTLPYVGALRYAVFFLSNVLDSHE